jgi:peptide/nickel transport system ATP-binding protein
VTDKRNVLLRLENVKMHFPLKKTNLFQKGIQYVKAVDGVSIDIYEGETFGLVGESGCGKSTLGRLILQLYTQTAGSVRYRGATLNDYAPAYSFKDAEKVTLVKGTAEEIAQKYPKQSQLAGGLLLSDELPGVARALRVNLSAVKEVYRLKTLIHLLELRRVSYLENDKSGLDKIDARIKILSAELERAEAIRDKCDVRLSELRQSCAGKPGYDLLENVRDVSIDLSRLKKEEMRRLRRDLQIVFQDPYSSLNQRFSVGQLISEALVAHKMYKRGTKQLEEYTIGAMDKCGLQNYFLHRYPHQFSGGQRQRIGIARALALQPKFVVCDEAVSALDVSIQSQIINLLMDLKESQNLTYLFISHDLSTVKFISDRVAVMYLGNIIELGDSDVIFAEPLHPYTNVLLEAIPTTDEESKKELQVIEGDIPSPINPPPGCKFHTRCKYAADKCKTDVPEWRELRPRHWVACHFPVEKGGERA